MLCENQVDVSVLKQNDLRPSKEKLIILGTGFAAVSISRLLDLSAYDLTIISPRNHFLFSPLLPSTTVGTIEFHSISEPIRGTREPLTYIQAYARNLDPDDRCILCESSLDGRIFSVSYDKLIIAVGAANNTFGIEGVAEHAFFLKEISDAEKIRNSLLANLERASTPEVSEEEKKQLLHFVVVGGGPTGVEYAAELSDFFEDEITEYYPHLADYVQITIVEAGKQILSAFDNKLSSYAVKVFNRRNVSVLTNSVVKRVTSDAVILADGTELHYGQLVWSTGNTGTDFARALPFEKDRAQRIVTDLYFRVKGHDDIFALGDCATVEGYNQPATAQVAMQSGKHLSHLLNKLPKAGTLEKAGHAFKYHHLGMLAYIGDNRALADLPATKSGGITTWIFWRSAYLTRLVSTKNKLQVLFDWIKATLFGRDLSQF